MHRLSNQLRALVAQSSQFSNSSHSLRSCLRLLHHQPLRTVAPNVKWSLSNSLLNASTSSLIKSVDFKQFSFPLPLVHVRHVSSRERRKRKKPMTPITSKVKKIKIKSYSSYKLRFRTMNDGSIRRWREGKNHNAHEKSKKSKRRLRRPSTVPTAYAKVMKRLNFCG
ncbi:hypothetical protein K2173_009697 [Erythroxylum novogranatense]|uniref:50S ribosomal protein L35 n=1 Tax=Erythroxylum novogranatense TaxID=1862640 RepID=A0AAV8U4N4_9ROSI|nr:hypothetical protein K2173_009697 [Erythroxylum novogranatense]